eukprot:CAMPEP_0177314308 /NCGR_PEP_ID=MMETSP0368-20130122/11865_1 /TAXON_ID=447022 ORGANISM="Scrippsiella hangoei-like, Strain SHHI-4" /NCGR_SAMPLE_ID=MMETSP0368 /ASSEMBLY_ACC=CAM_ASM_000363 /LENGTH=135 /DNA_ID=CAMNT_0018773449 /DNA_START=29 /DNA_END=436 /DNA_ORIENTATION=+
MISAPGEGPGAERGALGHVAWQRVVRAQRRPPKPREDVVMFGNLSILSSLSMSLVSGSTWIMSTSTSERSGTYSILRSRSSSCNLSEMPRTGPRWILFMRWVANPAILLCKRFEGMLATSSEIFLFIWKSKVSLA